MTYRLPILWQRPFTSQWQRPFTNQIIYGTDPLPITYGRDPLPITLAETLYQSLWQRPFTNHLWQSPGSHLPMAETLYQYYMAQKSPMTETLYQSLWQRPFTNHLWQIRVPDPTYLWQRPFTNIIWHRKSPMTEAQTIPSFCPLQVLYILPLNHSKVLIYQWPTVRPAGWVLSVYNNNYITVTERPRGAIFFLFPWKQHGLP